MNLKLYKKYFIYSTADKISYNLLHGGHEGNVAEWSEAQSLRGMGSNPTTANSPLHDSGKLQLHFLLS